MTKLQVSELTARSLYWKLIGDNKTFFHGCRLLLLFALFFYVALSKMTSIWTRWGRELKYSVGIYGTDSPDHRN